MKLPDFKVDIEKSETFNEEKFGIGNTGFVLNILRNKLYSNIIESCCREYASNARDAHREIGTPDRPIEIHFPNAFESNFSIKDYGIGISPERMSNVFLQYGNSTKRNDNSQLGGFGLGAKLFMGYSEQFTIITISKDKEINTKRTYILFIDSSQEGRLNLVKEEVTSEPTGTEVICAVQDKDIKAFIDGTLKSTQYWNVRPLLFGLNPMPEWPSSVGELLAEGTKSNWKIYNVQNWNQFSRSKAESLAIIDGIQYKINESFVNVDDRWILSCNVHMYFDIGQLTLSASRESLQYDENTKKLINERIQTIQKELSEQIIEILDKKESYVEAVEFYTFMKKYFYKVFDKNNLTWRGNKIIGPEISLNKDVLFKTNAQINSYSKHKSRRTGMLSVRKSNDSDIIINSSTEIYFNDLNPKHIYRSKHLKALESHNVIQIINYVKGKTYDDFVKNIKSEYQKCLNSPEYSGMALYHRYEDNSWIFNVVKPKLLSSIIEDKIPSKPRVVKPKTIGKISAHKLVYGCDQLRNCFTNSDIEFDAEGYYIEANFKNRSCWTEHNGSKWYFSTEDLAYIKILLGNNNLYSIKEKDFKKITKLKPLSEFLEKEFDNFFTEDYFKSIILNKFVTGYNSGYYNNFNCFYDIDINKIKSSQSLVKIYCNYIKNDKGVISIDFIKKLESKIKNTNNADLHAKSIEDLLKKMKSRYGLLAHLDKKAYSKDVIDYINYCDEKYNQKENLKLKTGELNEN